MTTKYNNLSNYRLTIQRFIASNDAILAALTDFAQQHPRVYSYCLIDKNNEYWFSVHVSTNTDYNTIDLMYSVPKVLESITVNRLLQRNGKIIAYAQPPLEVLCDAMTPLVYSLANEQHRHWKHIELNDLIQRCYCTLCELYNKGYYIHKALLRKSYKNAVISYLRVNPAPDRKIVSFDEPISGDDDSLSILDTLSDTFYDEISEYENEIAEKELYKHIREWVIETIGQEAYNKLVYEYSNKKVSSSTSHLKRKLINKLKNNRDKFIKKFMGE